MCLEMFLWDVRRTSWNFQRLQRQIADVERQYKVVSAYVKFEHLAHQLANDLPRLREKGVLNPEQAKHVNALLTAFQDITRSLKDYPIKEIEAKLQEQKGTVESAKELRAKAQ